MMFFFLFFSLARGIIYSLPFDNKRKGEKVYWWEKGKYMQIPTDFALHLHTNKYNRMIWQQMQ